MDKLWKCIHHEKPNELYCKTCKNYICAECISNHMTECTSPQYLHVFHYSPEIAMPLLDNMLKEICAGTDSEINVDAMEFISNLSTIVPTLKEAISLHAQSVNHLKNLVNQIEQFLAPLQQQSFVDRIRMGLTADKKRLEQALKSKDLQTVISITRKVEAESVISGGGKKDKELIGKVKSTLSSLSDLKAYKELIAVTQLLICKCEHLRLNQCIGNWKCDKKYVSTKMTLSEDGLTYGNQAGSGYPSIIGDVPFEYGMFAFEVTPSGLCCNGKEGFGIIDLEKYKAAHAADNTTPVTHDNMIGLLYNNVAKNMTVVANSEMRMNEKHVVKVDLVNLKMTIKGTGCSLKADLQPNVTYVPVFSLGCRNNKLIIKPLESFDD